MRFEQFLRDSAVRFPDKTALVASGKRLTFSQLDDLSDELAQGLIDRGIARRSRRPVSGQQSRGGCLDICRAQGRRRVQPR